MDFFKRLNFTSSNEDGSSEVAALSDAKRILCLTGSGGRALDLLLTDAREIISLDMNKAQNALLALKIVAIKHLDYHDYLGFIGVIQNDKRLETLSTLLGDLSSEDKQYWLTNSNKIKKGIWYDGVWERVLCANAKLLNLLKGKQIKALFAAPTIQEQAKIWQRDFDKPLLRIMIRVAANRFLWTHILGEPGGAFLPPPAKVSKMIATRFSEAASQFMFKNSDFATLIFKGKQNDGLFALPLHMQAHHYQNIKDKLNRIRIVTGRLDQLQELQISMIDGFSLSDFGSYTNNEQYSACWQSIIAASTKQASFCERLFMVNHKMPFDVLQIDEAKSLELSKKDMAIIYNIRVGKIGKKDD